MFHVTDPDPEQVELNRRERPMQAVYCWIKTWWSIRDKTSRGLLVATATSVGAAAAMVAVPFDAAGLVAAVVVRALSAPAVAPVEDDLAVLGLDGLGLLAGHGAGGAQGQDGEDCSLSVWVESGWSVDSWCLTSELHDCRSEERRSFGFVGLRSTERECLWCWEVLLLRVGVGLF